MRLLEKLTKGYFERYSKRTTNSVATWSRLSPERKEVWMKEILFMMDYIVDELKVKFKEPPQIPQNSSSLSTGYAQGVATERMETVKFIEFLEENLEADLEEFIDLNKRK